MVVLLYLCAHPLSQNDQVQQGRESGVHEQCRQGNRCGGWACFLRSATPSVSSGHDTDPSGPHFGGSPLVMRTRFEIERANSAW